MGRQIIKKKNGLYAVWSTIVDDFIMDDMTDEQVVSIFVEEAKEQMTINVKTIISDLNENKNPYYQFAMTYEEACKYKKEVNNNS